MAAQKLTRKQVRDQIKAFKDAACSGDCYAGLNPCVAAVRIATSDDRVVDKIQEKIDAGFVPKGIACVTPDDPADQIRQVLWRFESDTSKFEIFPASFIVVVSLAYCQVLHIRDPWIPELSPQLF